MDSVEKSKGRYLSAFLKSESGAIQTIEFVIWMPIFVFIIIITMNISMVFYKESQMLRIVQDANRNVSMGRIRASTHAGTELKAEDFVSAQIAYLNVTPTVSATFSGGIITTELSVPAVELMPFTLLDGYFQDKKVSVKSSHFVEY